MNETRAHFIAVCPNCSASLRVNRQHVGQHVICKHCEHTFRAMMANEPINPSSGESTAGPLIQPLPPSDRVAVSCPSCQATLSVRRVYIGNQVRCKQCGNTFLVRDPDQPQPESGVSAPDSFMATRSPQGDIERESHGTAAEREPVPTHDDQLPAKYERLQTAHDELGAEHNRLTRELDTIRDRLGTISPDEVRTLAEERESLSTLVSHLRDEINGLLAERPARALLAEQLGQRDAELDSARAERERLTKQIEQRDQDLRTARADRELLAKQIEQRDKDLKTARGECDLLTRQIEQAEVDLNAALVEQGRLSIERKTVAKEVEQLRSALEERDQAMRDAAASLRGEIEAHAGLKSDYQSLLDSGRVQQEQWAEQIRELRAQSEESARRAMVSPAEDLIPSSAQPALDGELEAARDQIADLKRQLDDLEHLNRELSDVLHGMGINYKPMKL